MKVKLDVAKLRELMKTAPRKVDRAVQDTAEAVEAIAKVNVPRDPKRPPLDPSRPVTGFLRNSIAAEKVEDGHWRVNVGAEYGLYQELGTSRMPARPYLTPAAEAQQGPFIQRLIKVLDE